MEAELNAAIWAASKGIFSTIGLFNAEEVKTPLAVLSGFDPAIASKNIDLSKTYANRFAEAAAQRVK